MYHHEAGNMMVNNDVGIRISNILFSIFIRLSVAYRRGVDNNKSTAQGTKKEGANCDFAWDRIVSSRCRSRECGLSLSNSGLVLARFRRPKTLSGLALRLRRLRGPNMLRVWRRCYRNPHTASRELTSQPTPSQSNERLPSSGRIASVLN